MKPTSTRRESIRPVATLTLISRRAEGHAGLALLLLLGLLCAPSQVSVARADEVDDLLGDIATVKTEPASARARQAWDKLVRKGAPALPRILVAMDTPDSVLANWLRLAFDAIAGANEKGVDVDALLSYARDGKRQGRARRLALDLAERLRPGSRDKLLANALHDEEFRHDAIARILESIGKEKDLPRDKQIAILRDIFAASRDLEQSRAIAARLKERGVNVSVAEHMGFLGDWYLIGPFPLGSKGFQVVHPPEKSVALDATLPGKDGKKLRWQRHTVAEAATGRFPILVELTKPLGQAEDAVAYAWTALEVAEERHVEFRGAGDDNLTVWVNGERVFGFEEYRNGVRLDRHRFPVKLRKGNNTILVKICQAPAEGNPAPNWEFLLRITDPSGRGITYPSALKSR